MNSDVSYTFSSKDLTVLNHDTEFKRNTSI